MQIVSKIEKLHAVIGGTENFPIALTTTAFGFNSPRLDIRRWRIENGEYSPLKGLQLTDTEAASLRDALIALNLDGDTTDPVAALGVFRRIDIYTL